MDKLYFSNDDINSIIFTINQAIKKNNRPAALNICKSLRRLALKATNGQVDFEDVNVLFEGLQSVERLLKPVDLELENNRLERENEMLLNKLKWFAAEAHRKHLEINRCHDIMYRLSTELKAALLENGRLDQRLNVYEQSI